MEPQIKKMNTDEDVNQSNCLLNSFFNGISSQHNELNQLSETIIGCAFKVGNILGCGFLEKVYENAMVIELRKNWLDRFTARKNLSLLR